MSFVCVLFVSSIDFERAIENTINDSLFSFIIVNLF